MSVIGFGGTIPLESKDVCSEEKLFHLVKAEELPASELLRHLGHRHLAAYRLCQRVTNSLAFVISQDGDLRFFANDNGRLCFADGLCP